MCFSLQPDHDDHVLNLQFSWHELVKPVGSTFIGTSPEFEMALFTVIFLMNTERSTTVLVNIDQCQMEVVVIRHGRSLGTAYPKLLSSNSRHFRHHSQWVHFWYKVILGTHIYGILDKYNHLNLTFVIQWNHKFAVIQLIKFGQCGKNPQILYLHKPAVPQLWEYSVLLCRHMQL